MDFPAKWHNVHMVEKTMSTALVTESSGRFDPDGQCRSDCATVVLRFFFPNDYQVFPESVSANFDNMSTYFSKSGFNVLEFTPWYFVLFAPMLTRGTTTEPAKRNHSRRRFYGQFSRVRQRCAIVHFATAHDLYGIKELWNHCVVELCRSEGMSYYDGLLPRLVEEYRWSEPRIPEHEDLQRFPSAKLLIWKDEL